MLSLPFFILLSDQLLQTCGTLESGRKKMKGDVAGCKEGEQQERWEISVIWWEIWLWKREKVCEGVGKLEGCEQEM